MADTFGGAYADTYKTLQDDQRATAMAPALLAHTIATTRLNNAQATLEEHSADVEKAAAARLAQGVANGTVGNLPMSQKLEAVSQAYLEAGGIAKATDALKASTAAKRAETLQSETQFKQMMEGEKENLNMLTKLSGAIDAVKSPEDWARLREAATKSQPPNSPIRQMFDHEYDPAYLDTLKSFGMTLRDKKMLEMRTAEAEFRRRNVENQIISRGVRDQVAQAREAREEAKAKDDRKAGGKDAGAPTSEQIKQAAGVLATFPTITLPAGEDVRRTAAMDVATEAKALMVRTKMQWNDALRQTIAAKKERGDFEAEIEPPTKVLGFSLPGTGSTKPAYSIHSKPQELPPSKDKLEAGKLYTDPSSGKAWKWDGSKWVKP